MWNFASQGLLNVSLLFTDAMRASFITQTAIVLTPVISSLRGQKVSRMTWVGCAFALAGVASLASDTGGHAAAAAASAARGLNVGDMLALGGAATYSLYIFRLSELGARGLSTDLTQAVKTMVLAVLYLLWASTDAFGALSKGLALRTLWPGCASALAWGVLLYSAVVPGAIADVAQGRGQSKLGATESQVLLSAEPLWTATISMLILGERMGAWPRRATHRCVLPPAPIPAGVPDLAGLSVTRRPRRVVRGIPGGGRGDLRDGGGGHALGGKEEEGGVKKKTRGRRRKKGPSVRGEYIRCCSGAARARPASPLMSCVGLGRSDEEVVPAGQMDIIAAAGSFFLHHTQHQRSLKSVGLVVFCGMRSTQQCADFQQHPRGAPPIHSNCHAVEGAGEMDAGGGGDTSGCRTPGPREKSAC